MLCLLLAAHPAGAITCTATATSTSFGVYNPASLLPLDGVGNVRVACSTLLLNVLVGYDILLSPGGGGSYGARRMANGSSSMTYNLYTDLTRLSVWGDGSGGSAMVSDGYLLMLLALHRDYPVYGRIPAGQNLPAGSYTDTILVTVNY
ncbi:MAG: spore coat U domain-containing protein [Candidatus Bathyarchaeota archaeon]